MTLPWRLEEWPPDAREDYEERAAILQYDARLPRDRAEAIAEEWCRKAWRARPASLGVSSSLGEGGQAGTAGASRRRS